MSLSAILTALSEYVADRVAEVKDVDGSTRLPPERVVRYWGSPPMPSFVRSEAGYVVTQVDREVPSQTFPIAARTNVAEAPFKIVAAVSVRYMKCWTPPRAIASGLVPMWDQWDRDTAVLAEIQDHISKALVRLNCGSAPTQAWRDAFGDVPCGGFFFASSEPIPPRTDRAGVLWRVQTTVRNLPAPS